MPFVLVVNHNGEDWEEITERLYMELLRFENECRDIVRAYDATRNGT